MLPLSRACPPACTGGIMEELQLNCFCRFFYMQCVCMHLYVCVYAGEQPQILAQLPAHHRQTLPVCGGFTPKILLALKCKLLFQFSNFHLGWSILHCLYHRTFVWQRCYIRVPLYAFLPLPSMPGPLKCTWSIYMYVTSSLASIVCVM